MPPGSAGEQSASRDRTLTTPAPGSRAWIMWGLGALFFGFGFFLRVSPSVMIDSLMADLDIGGAVLGNLSAFYFYAYAGLQLPVGILVDRWGPRATLGAALALCAAGTLLFALSANVALLYLGRLAIGAGAAFSFVGCLKLATAWFPRQRFALMSGLTMMAGMVGGVLGQAPLAAAVEAVGWRASLVAAGAFGILLALAILAVVRDRPAGSTTEGPGAFGIGVLSALRAVMAVGHNWRAGLVTASMTAPLLGFAGLWGVSWLMQVHDLSRAEAAATTSLWLIGWGVGAPLAGWVSDRVHRRRAPLVVASALGLGVMLALLFSPHPPRLLLSALFFLGGLSLSHMVLTFALVGESNASHLSGTAYAFVNTFAVGAGALFQPLIGGVLDLGWDGRMEAGARFYDAATYQMALAILPGFLILGLVLTLTLRETRAEQAV